MRNWWFKVLRKGKKPQIKKEKYKMANLTSKQKSDYNRMNRAAKDGGLGTQLEHVYPIQAVEAKVAAGAITNKNGIVTLAKTVAGVIAMTLGDPTAVTDDYKVLRIINAQAQANTVTSATSFGGGGTSFDVATFDAAIGGTLSLMAYNGKWYVIGSYGVTLA